MRRPIKPFAVEIRRSSRKSPGSAAQAGEDQPEAQAAAQPAPKPVAEEADQGYLAALRAADALFGKTSEPVRPVSPAIRAAEDAFRSVAREDAPPSSPVGAGRILPSLIERTTPEPADEQAEDGKAEDVEQPRRSRLGRTRHSPVRRLDTSEIDAAAYAAHFDDAPSLRAAAPPPPGTDAAAPRSPGPDRLRGYVRGRIYARWVTHEAIRPGERWKLRLGRLVK